MLSCITPGQPYHDTVRMSTRSGASLQVKRGRLSIVTMIAEMHSLNDQPLTNENREVQREQR
ncbi:MAG: hypothetical protein ABSH09_09425 [Bryobacteraceae bacterium]